jgi:hypothetical protein
MIPGLPSRHALFACWTMLFGFVVGVVLPCGVHADVRLPVDVKINDTPVRFAIDTGAGLDLMLFASAAEELGLDYTPASTGPTEPGKVNVGHTVPAKFEWDGVIYGEVQFGVVDAPLPVDISGVIGWPIFRQHVLTLKLAENLVHLGDEVPDEAQGWRKLPLVPGADTLRFKANATPQDSGPEILIDTGDDEGVTLPAKLWREWRSRHADLATTMNVKYTPSKGLVIYEVVPVREIVIGDITLRHVAVQGPEQDPPKGTKDPTLVTFGLAALARLDVVTDGTAGDIYLQARQDEPVVNFPINRLGAVFVPDLAGKDDLIAHVAPHSPASSAGIRNGDVLLKIDQLDVTSWRTQPGILPLARFWEQPAGAKLKLTLKRKKKTITINATLADLRLADIKAAKPYK